MLRSNNKFKFDFGNISKFLISHIIEFLENIGAILITWIILFFLVYVLLGNLPDCFVKEFVSRTLAVMVGVLDLFFIALVFIPKRVILTDDKILVHRFCFPLQATFWDIRGLNDSIAYSQIISCQRHEGETRFGARKPFFCVNDDSLVEIRTNQKTYLLPIKDYDEFICEVNKRIYNNIRND